MWNVPLHCKAEQLFDTVNYYNIQEPVYKSYSIIQWI